MKVKRTRFKHYLMSPYKNSRSIVSLQQIGNTQGGKTKTGPGLHPKAQISILPPGKYQRPARFREGVDFSDPLPLSKRQFKQRLCQFRGREGSF
jgi:hypothetical protein